MAGPGR